MIPAPTPDRGRKHTCTGCEARFYDLNKKPPVCPRCNQRVAAVKAAAPGRRGARANAADAKPSPAGFQAVAAQPKQKRLKYR